MSAVEIVRLVDMVMGIAMRFGISLAEFNRMKDENNGAPLTDEQVAELANQAHQAVDQI